MPRCGMFVSLPLAGALASAGCATEPESTPAVSQRDDAAPVGPSRLAFPLHASMTHLCDFEERIYLEEGPHISVDVELWTSPRPAAELSAWYDDQRATDPKPWATRPKTPDQSHHREVEIGPVEDARRGNGNCNEQAPPDAVSGVRLADGWW